MISEYSDVNSEIILKHDNFLRITPLEIKYYNIIFTEEEVILDYRNSSFKPWILRVNAYKELPYEGLSIQEIRNRSEGNVVLSYGDFDEIKLSKRTFFKNACIEMKRKNNDDILRLVSKEKVDFSTWQKIRRKFENVGCKLMV